MNKITIVQNRTATHRTSDGRTRTLHIELVCSTTKALLFSSSVKSPPGPPKSLPSKAVCCGGDELICTVAGLDKKSRIQGTTLISTCPLLVSGNVCRRFIVFELTLLICVRSSKTRDDFSINFSQRGWNRDKFRDICINGVESTLQVSSKLGKTVDYYWDIHDCVKPIRAVEAERLVERHLLLHRLEEGSTL